MIPSFNLNNKLNSKSECGSGGGSGERKKRKERKYITNGMNVSAFSCLVIVLNNRIAHNSNKNHRRTSTNTHGFSFFLFKVSVLFSKICIKTDIFNIFFFLSLFHF